MKFHLVTAACLLALATSLKADDHSVEHYVIDTPGAHAFVQFKISHLGFSWLYGRFNDFEGHFTYDPDHPENSSVEVTIQTTSVDSNHERRDDHLRNEDFLTVEEYPESHFRSTSFERTGEGTYRMTGDFTLLGVTRELEMDVEQVGVGEDPWGNFRRGFHATTSFRLADFGIDYDLGEEAEVVKIILDVEGIKKED